MEEDIGFKKNIDSEESPVSVEEAVEVTYEEIFSNESNSTSDSEPSHSTPAAGLGEVNFGVTDILMPPPYMPANWTK